MNSVVKKSIVAVTGALALIVAGGSSVHAYTSWQAGKGYLDETSRHIDTLTKHIAGIKADQKKSLDDVNKLQAEAEKLQKQLKFEPGISSGLKKELLDTHANWSKEVSEKEQEKETIQSKLNAVNNQISEKEQTIKNNANEINRLNDELAKAKDKSSEDDKKISELEKAVSDAKDLRDKAQKAVDQLANDQAKKDQAKQ